MGNAKELHPLVDDLLPRVIRFLIFSDLLDKTERSNGNGVRSNPEHQRKEREFIEEIAHVLRSTERAIQEITATDEGASGGDD